MICNLGHQRVDPLIGDADEGLRCTLCSACIAVNLDKAIREIHAWIIPDPCAAELQPILKIAGLIEADQQPDDVCLSWIRYRRGFRQILVRFPEIIGVKSRRDASVGRTGAIHLFDQFSGAGFEEARVERVALLEAF